MFELKSNQQPVYRAFLVGVHSREESEEEARHLLDELRELVSTLGIETVGSMRVKVNKYQARFLVGSGKTDEIIEISKKHRAEILIFDNVITPGQQRNWEKVSELAVIDREEVILDIFARRARTREARLQVELARMEYSLPRLKRAWTHLSRQAGSGAGMTGAGETQLEVDRRLVRKRIDGLKLELEEVIRQRATRRKLRLRRPTPHASIVGYTNAGKSSLFRALTGESVLVEDKLFATLDTTTRNLDLPLGHRLLLTDTVGFVRKLPHRLVESFKATLEEAVLSDFLIHVVDVSNSEWEAFHETTLRVLEELGADVKRLLLVFNKVDCIKDPAMIQSLQGRFPDALFLSAKTGEGVEELKLRMSDWLSGLVCRTELLIPQARYDLISNLHRSGKVLSEAYEGDSVRLSAFIPPKLLSKYQNYIYPVRGSHGIVD